MPDDSQQELAKQRTDLAEQRTLLAQERTFAAWVRTGLAAMAVGVAVAQILREVEPEWTVRTAGAVLIGMGAVIHVLGFWSYRKSFRALRREKTHSIPLWLIAVIIAALVLSAGLLLVPVVRP